ncbi:hypothetical protein [Ralstonia chuxiongensis]|uniref:hypothetical protein n=1 Tax=Ralstonia chuxiongensis TaxID=2957504 RepID=UPI0028F4FFB8|nr:hypothetical protein [Ralstonia chuxiongensis]CAJ0779838.1 hypothetical protein R8510_04667 [Ralstonia chuxiongensis]
MTSRANSTSRYCFYFPILHGSADLGNVASKRKQPEMDPAARQQYFSGIDGMWVDIEKAILSLNLDYARTHVYQDGLPICGWETEIVDELAGAGSCNHRLLQALQDRGATLMGTESPEHLVAEYDLTMQIFGADNPRSAQAGAQRTRAAALLEQRDRFIARRIDDTLPAGYACLLFIGALHRVALFLSADITVIYPIGIPAPGSLQ